MNQSVSFLKKIPSTLKMRYIFILILFTGCMTYDNLGIPDEPIVYLMYSEVRDETRYISSQNLLQAVAPGYGITSAAHFICESPTQCDPENVLLIIYVNMPQQIVHNEADLALLIGENRYRYDAYEINSNFDGTIISQYVSFEIPIDEFISLANHENVKGELLNLKLDFTYQNRSNYRYLLQCLGECETEEFDLPYDY